MTHLLDTNVIIAILRGEVGVIKRLTELTPANVAISSVVLHELFYGAHRSARVEENVDRIHALRFSVLDLDAGDAEVAGNIRATLAAEGQPIGPYDVLIAGQALARNLLLVTRNLREFKRVDGLRVENWEDG